MAIYTALASDESLLETYLALLILTKDNILSRCAVWQRKKESKRGIEDKQSSSEKQNQVEEYMQIQTNEQQKTYGKNSIISGQERKWGCAPRGGTPPLFFPRIKPNLYFSFLPAL